MSQETKELSQVEQARIRLLQTLEGNVALIDMLSKKMSSRQLGRVLRSLMGYPFRDEEKLTSQEEKAVFEAGKAVMDSKVMLVMQDHSDEVKQQLEEVKKEAQRLEQEENKENE